MKRLAVCIGLAVLLAAVRPATAFLVPQSREEFKRAVADGGRGTAMETFVVEESFDAVYRLLAARSSSCLDVLVKRSGFVGDHMEVSSSDYNPSLRKVSGGKAEFSLQVVNRPRGVGGGPPPPGGLYLMAADIRSLGKGRLEVTLYRPSFGFKKIVGAVKDWLQGQDAPCPKMR